MSYTEEVMKEIQDDLNRENPQPQETPAPEPQPAPEPEKETPAPAPTPEPAPEPSPEPEKPQETPQETPAPEPEKPQEAPNPGKPDFSSLTREEKAQHAFQRQLAKQKQKFEDEKKAMQESWQKQFDELKKTVTAKPPEPKKTRDQFDTDDEFFDYLAQTRVDAIMAERDSQAAKEAEKKAQQDREAQEQQRAMQEQADNFRSNCTACFKDPERLKAFEDRVALGTKNGLAEVLDQNPCVRDYIFMDPNGPLVLNEMLNDKTAFMRVMSRAGNPMSATIEMHTLAHEIATREQQAPQAQPQPQQHAMPAIGKPGAGQKGGGAVSMWNDDDALIEYVRSHR